MVNSILEMDDIFTYNRYIGNMADIKYTDLSGLDYFSDKIKSILDNKANTSSLGSYYTKAQVNDLLLGKANSSHGNHVPTIQTANNAIFLRNDNTWATVTPANIGAAASSHTHSKSDVGLGNVDNTADANKSVNYAASAGIASGLSLVSGSFTATKGWYKLARIKSTDARGSVRLGIITTGGSYTPRYTELKVSNGWSSIVITQNGKFDWISAYRYTIDGTYSYIEAYFTSACDIYLRKISGLGYVDDSNYAWELYSSAVAGSGTIESNTEFNKITDSTFYTNGNICSAGYSKVGSDNNYVLLGGTGHKPISDFSLTGHTHDYAAPSHTHTKSQITDFSHTHDDRYYTESEIDTKLNGKSNTGHTHDDRYYTESEIDTKLSGKSNTGHTHDDRYYTETEIDTKLAGKSNTGHTHSNYLTALPTHEHGIRNFANIINNDPIRVGWGQYYVVLDRLYHSNLPPEIQNGDVLIYSLFIDNSEGNQTTYIRWQKWNSESDRPGGIGTGVAAGNKQWVSIELTIDTNYQRTDLMLNHNGASTSYVSYSHLTLVKKTASKVPDWTINPNLLITTDNIGSQSVNYATSAGSAPASDVHTWAKATNKPTYTKSEVGLGNVDNTADANKSVKYATSSNYSKNLLGRKTNGTDYDAVDGNLVFAEWNTYSDNRWYLKATGYETRVGYANSAGSAVDQTARNAAATAQSTADGKWTYNATTIKGVKVNNAVAADILNCGSYNKSTDITFDKHMWVANGACEDVPSMGYSSVLNVGYGQARRWQIWNTRNNHVLLWRPEKGDMSDWAEIHTLIDNYNIGSYALTSLPSHTHTKSQITDFPSSLPANGGNADTVDNVHLEWSGSQAASSTDWLAGWNSDGTKIKAVKRSDLSVNYATTAGSAVDQTARNAASTAQTTANGKWTYNADTIKAVKVNNAGNADTASGLSRNTSSFSVSSAGWYKLAYIATTDARGSVRLGIYTVGGDYTPRYSELRVSNGWSVIEFCHNGRFDWITKYRYTTDSTNSYIEAYFSGKCTVNLAVGKGVMYVDDISNNWNLYSSAVAGSGTVAQLFDKPASHSSFFVSGNISTASSMTAASGFFQTSDERLKDFRDDIQVDFEKLSKLRKKYFTWKSDEDKKLEIGISAQEIQEIYPELVTENSEGTLTVAYDKLSVIALKAVDELDERLKRIEKMLNI